MVKAKPRHRLTIFRGPRPAPAVCVRWVKRRADIAAINVEILSAWNRVSPASTASCRYTTRAFSRHVGTMDREEQSFLSNRVRFFFFFFFFFVVVLCLL